MTLPHFESYSSVAWEKMALRTYGTQPHEIIATNL